MHSGCFPGETIWIFTADDGWSDMHDTLFPIAKRYGVPFFVGIISDRIGKPGYVSEADIVEMSRDPLITISSHSVHHTDNSKLSAEEVTREMCDSRSTLENLTGKSVKTYIYPSGRVKIDLDGPIAEKCGYTLAWSTSFGTDWNAHSGSLYSLNRRRISADTDPHVFEKWLEKR
jgi:peptidoglycan/xylan/chitin deacetylase (PgdA/CDA1 family)